MAAKIAIFLDFYDNYRYLIYKYRIGIHVWHLPLWRLYKNFDFYLPHYYNKVVDGMIRITLWCYTSIKLTFMKTIYALCKNIAIIVLILVLKGVRSLCCS